VKGTPESTLWDYRGMEEKRRGTTEGENWKISNGL
jgi:hypothetical protein